MRHPKSSNPKKILQSKFFLIIGILIVCFLGLNFYRVWTSNHGVNQEINDLKTQIESEKQKNSDLSELIEYLNSSAYIEKKARTDLGLKKAGEKTVVITGLDFDLTSQTKELNNHQSAVTNFERWQQYFFK